MTLQNYAVSAKQLISQLFITLHRNRLHFQQDEVSSLPCCNNAICVIRCCSTAGTGETLARSS